MKILKSQFYASKMKEKCDKKNNSKRFCLESRAGTRSVCINSVFDENRESHRKPKKPPKCAKVAFRLE